MAPSVLLIGRLGEALAVPLLPNCFSRAVIGRWTAPPLAAAAAPLERSRARPARPRLVLPHSGASLALVVFSCESEEFGKLVSAVVFEPSTWCLLGLQPSGVGAFELAGPACSLNGRIPESGRNRGAFSIGAGVTSGGKSLEIAGGAVGLYGSVDEPSGERNRGAGSLLPLGA